MTSKVRKSFILGVGIVSLAFVAGTLVAQPGTDSKAKPQPTKDAKPAAPGLGEMKLPPGWTAEDMMACAVAGQPGEMHEKLMKGAGVWQGKTTMWMGAGSDPMPPTDTTTTNTPMFDGRYLKTEMSSEIPGMGHFTGFGLTGFDNVSQKFVSTWIDNQSSGIMNGVGELSKDGKTVTFNYTFNCPLTKKPAVIRQVETYTSDNTMTLEMFTTDPKSNKEYKMMHGEFTRK